MSALDDAIRHQRAEALRIERERQRALLEAYRQIEARLRTELDALAAAIAEAQAAGVEVTPAILSRGRTAIPNVQALKGETYAEAAERVRRRYDALLAQTEAELARYGRFAEGVIANGQRAAATTALGTAEGVLAAARGTPPPGVATAFNRLPVAAIEELVGNLGDGRPLRELLDGLGEQASAAARQALIEGLGKGLSPRQLAREFRLGTNTSAVRALLISRTEINRAYRDSTLATYRQNAGVVSGWRWVCAGSKRTCPACWAKHGAVYPLDRPFGSHPACRCCAVPVTKSWAELGFGDDIPDTRPAIPDRDELFGKLTEAERRRVLGATVYALWEAGEVDLADMATPTRSARWGPGIRVTPLYALRQQLAQAAD